MLACFTNLYDALRLEAEMWIYRELPVNFISKAVVMCLWLM